MGAPGIALLLQKGNMGYQLKDAIKVTKEYHFLGDGHDDLMLM
jgi:hypothetical protein